MEFAKLQQSIGHEFSDTTLLKNALTHRSHSANHNERLEFLGDGILNCVIAHQLYLGYPSLPEGDLSRLRALLVCQDMLHQLAQALCLGDYLLLGEGELRSGGHRRPSILADALEAILGAIYLDAGFEKVSGVVVKLFAPHLKNLPSGQQMKDAKTRLQEWLQARRHPLPKYSLQTTRGEAHAQDFEVVCDIPALKLRTIGNGSSRRMAEQAAAQKALEAINP